MLSRVASSRPTGTHRGPSKETNSPKEGLRARRASTRGPSWMAAVTSLKRATRWETFKLMVVASTLTFLAFLEARKRTFLNRARARKGPRGGSTHMRRTSVAKAGDSVTQVGIEGQPPHDN